MRKFVIFMSLCGIGFGNVATAQENFDVQAAMEQVRNENLQRSGVERQQQITSVLRKRAEDLKAIHDAGFRITEDGKLERVGPGVGPAMGQGPTQSLQSGMSLDGNEMGMDMNDGASSASLFNDSESGPDADMNDEPDSGFMGGGSSYTAAPNYQLRGILTDSAVFEINDRRTRLAEGDNLPGGYVLADIGTDSVEVTAPDGSTRTLYMDWSSPVAAPQGMGQSQDGNMFMQSGAPTGGAF